MSSLSLQSPFLQAEQTQCPQPLLIRPHPSRPFPILVASFGCSLIASCLSYHGVQKSHTGLKVRPHLQTYLSKGKRKEPGKLHMPTAGKQSKSVHIAKTWTANIHSHCISILLCIWEMNLILRGSVISFPLSATGEANSILPNYTAFSGIIWKFKIYNKTLCA